MNETKRKVCVLTTIKWQKREICGCVILKNRVSSKSLKINALLNVIKQCCAIISPMITFPYVSRMLGVEAYGKVNFSTSIVGYVTLVAGLGISSYAVRDGSRLKSDKSKFTKFVNEVFSINILSTVIAYILLGLLLLCWPELKDYRVIIMILSLNVLMGTLGTDWINTVYEDFLYITIRYVVCQAVVVVATLLLINSEKDIYIYAIVLNSGNILASILNMAYIRKKIGVKPQFIVKMNLKSHFKTILILFGNSVSSTIYLYSDSSMLGVLSGDSAVGYYTVASKIYSLIKQLLNAITIVAIPRFSAQLALGEKNKINDQFNGMLGTLIMLVLPCVAGIVCMGKEIILLISGIEYLPAKSALVILGVALIFSTIACLFVSVIMLAAGMEKKVLFSTTISAIVNIVLNFILIPQYSYTAAALTTLISECIIMCMGVYYTRGLIKLNIKKELFSGIVGFVWIVLLSCILKIIVLNDTIRLFVCICLGGGTYCILIANSLLKKNSSKKGV